MSGPDFYGCYWPDHSAAYNMTACNAGATASWCCGINDICLDNGYCLQTAGAWSNRLGRGACTDNTWSSNACPSMCSDVSTSSATGLYLAYDTPGGSFCCKYNFNTETNQCTNGTKGSTKAFSLPNGNVIYNRTNGATMIGGLTAKQLGSNASSPQATPSVASTGNSSVPAASATPASSSVLPVALGISIPLGLSLLAALIACAVLFLQNRKLRKDISRGLGQPKRPSDTSDLIRRQDLSPVSRSEHVMPPEKGSSTPWQQNRSPEHLSPPGLMRYSQQSPHTPAHEHYAAQAYQEPQTRIHELSPSSIGELPGQLDSSVSSARPI